MKPTVSVIIPTYNGAHKLPGILNALTVQTIKDFDLIVVVDGSTDATLAVVETYIPRFRSLEIYTQENQGRAAVRNVGVAKAAGDILIFFDDDMRPLPDCIEQHLNHYQLFPDAISSGAQIDEMEKAKNSFERYKASLSSKWAQPLLKYSEKGLPAEKLHLTAANLCLSKSVFSSLGGFDERLTDAEDFDLAIRASKGGIPVHYNHKAFAWHDDFLSIRSYIKRLRQYKDAHRHLRMLKPEIYQDVQLREPMKINMAKGVIFSLFKGTFLIDIFERNEGIVNFLPKRLTYKIYDWLTTANGVVFTEKQLD